jgi:diguanylate cyclase (GGDEF)-like protein
MVIGRLSFDFNHYESILHSKVLSLERQIKKSFQTSQNNLSSKYTTIAHQFMLYDDITTLHQNRQRELMYNTLKDHYLSLIKDDPNLYMMQFFNAENKTVLRMHKPEYYSDDVTKTRPMIAQVNNLKKKISAFEVCKNGIIYRIAVPFVNKKKHIGILEFGIKPDYVVDYIDKNFKVESKILVKSDSLKTLSTQKNFKQIGEYSIVSQNKIFEKISSKIDMTKSSQIVRESGESYIVVTGLNLENFNGESIAKIVVAKDITKFIEENTKARLSANSITITILILALLILFIIFTKYENDIINSYKKVSHLEKKSNYLKDKSDKDSLTNLYNKSYLNNYLSNFIKNDGKGVVLFFDIDYFKKCNDTHGHLVGDNILIKLSKSIRGNLRDDDLFARWGGEEFVILLENINIIKAPKIAEKIRKLVENTNFDNNINITISMGITAIREDDTLESLMLRVDELLYRAKEDGRNRCISDINL